MNSSPITAWNNVAAYFTFANHEAVVVGVFLLSVVATLLVIGSIIKRENRAEEVLGGVGKSANMAVLVSAEEAA